MEAYSKNDINVVIRIAYDHAAKKSGLTMTFDQLHPESREVWYAVASAVASFVSEQCTKKQIADSKDATNSISEENIALRTGINHLFTVMQIGVCPDEWREAIQKMKYAALANLHLSKVAAERYDEILKLRRELEDRGARAEQIPIPIVDRMIDAIFKSDQRLPNNTTERKLWRAWMNAAIGPFIASLKSAARDCENLWNGSGPDFITDVTAKVMKGPDPTYDLAGQIVDQLKSVNLKDDAYAAPARHVIATMIKKFITPGESNAGTSSEPVGSDKQPNSGK
ncbi:MAG: hypothetical protein KGL39_50045 [Patescibacteria group bacterium]|nr:hypothetical protein [Patescibacteria group bacterium]